MQVLVKSTIQRADGAALHSPPKKRRRRSRSASPIHMRVQQEEEVGAGRATIHGNHLLPDVDPQRARERERQLAQRLAEGEPRQEKAPFDAKAEYERLINTRSGGVYIPPARLRALQAQFTDKSSKEYQRLIWENLKKKINGLINKINTGNIKSIVPELFQHNLIRGRGLFCRSLMKAQAVSLTFTPIYATMAAVINTKLPQVGELLIKRLIVQFRKAFRRNDKPVCLSSTSFLAHLCNHQVVNEFIALQLIFLLLERPSDDSVEIAVGFMREVGAFLQEAAPKANNAAFERFRAILHEGTIEKRVQYMIEVLFQVRKDRYKDNPPISSELDLVEEEDQITHNIGLDDEDLDAEEGLNVFKLTSDLDKEDDEYAKIKTEILGEEGAESDDVAESGQSDSDEGGEQIVMGQNGATKILDRTNTDISNLRKTIYLTIQSSIDFEECVHKLLKLDLAESQEYVLCQMVIDSCSQGRTYSRFFGLIGERFCKLHRKWADMYAMAFQRYYDVIHQYDTNQLRNIAEFFSHLFATNSLGWEVMHGVHLSEEQTTSSSRIFIKILFQDLSEAMSLRKLKEKLEDPFLAGALSGMFPKVGASHMRFAINYFTSIGLGAVTEQLREDLKNAPVSSASSESGSYSDSASNSGSEYSR